MKHITILQRILIHLLIPLSLYLISSFIRRDFSLMYVIKDSESRALFLFSMALTFSFSFIISINVNEYYKNLKN